MPPFGTAVLSRECSLKQRIYYRLLGKPFSWEKPRLVLQELDPRPGDVVLDLGCRGGDYSAEIAARGARVLGLDINSLILGDQLHRRPPNLLFVVGDAHHLPLPPKSVSHVILCDCLEHLKDQERVLGEIHRTLRPGGTFIVTVPTRPGYPPHRVFSRLVHVIPDSLLLRRRAENVGRTLDDARDTKDGVTLARASEEQILEVFGHYRHYDEQSLSSALNKAGLRVIKLRRFQKLFESEMIYFNQTVRGFHSWWLYPLMRLVAQLDRFLPANYPGVGLLAVCHRPPESDEPSTRT